MSQNQGESQDERWWLQAGAEWCPFCDITLHAEGLSYCIACDRAVCMVCVNQGPDAGEIYCPECGAKPDSGEA